MISSMTLLQRRRRWFGAKNACEKSLCSKSTSFNLVKLLCNNGPNNQWHCVLCSLFPQCWILKHHGEVRLYVTILHLRNTRLLRKSFYCRSTLKAVRKISFSYRPSANPALHIKFEFYLQTVYSFKILVLQIKYSHASNRPVDLLFQTFLSACYEF
jgi:hypothetical protein